MLVKVSNGVGSYETAPVFIHPPDPGRWRILPAIDVAVGGIREGEYPALKVAYSPAHNPPFRLSVDQGAVITFVHT